MGWTNSSWESKKDVIDSCLKGINKNFEVLEYSETKSGLWIVVKKRGTELKAILFDAIEVHTDGKFKKFYVKNLPEADFPYYYDCPQHLVDMVPLKEAFMFSVGWREKRKSKFTMSE